MAELSARFVPSPDQRGETWRVVFLGEIREALRGGAVEQGRSLFAFRYESHEGRATRRVTSAHLIEHCWSPLGIGIEHAIEKRSEHRPIPGERVPRRSGGYGVATHSARARRRSIFAFAQSR
jgi:hypothetical protein